jgi:hypothetical protein
VVTYFVFYCQTAFRPAAKLIAEPITINQPHPFRSFSNCVFESFHIHNEIAKFNKPHQIIFFSLRQNRKRNTPTTEKCASFSSNSNHDNSQIIPYNNRTNTITQITVTSIKLIVSPEKPTTSPRVCKNHLYLSAYPVTSHAIPISFSTSLGSSQSASNRSDFDNKSFNTPIPYAVIPYPVFLHRYTDPLYP